MKWRDFFYDHFKYLEHDDDPNAQREIIKEHKDSTAIQLINALDEVETNPVKDEETQRAKVSALRCLIAKKLDFYDNGHAGFMIETFLDQFLSRFEKLNEEFEELQKNFKTHRHNMDKSYSEKPAW